MTEKGTPSISAVLPAYNEEENIAQAVSDTADALDALNADYEIIVVDDGSRDRTAEIVKSLQQDYPQLRLIEHAVNRGYGGALRSGFAAATKDLVFLNASDLQFDPREIENLLPLLKEAEIVNPYRAARQDPWHRKLNAMGWNVLMRLLFGYVARDIDCGFKLFRREVLEQVNLTTDSALLDTQLLVGAKKRGFRIAEVPVTHRPRTAGSQTGANLEVIVRAFQELLRYWWDLRQELAQERAEEKRDENR